MNTKNPMINSLEKNYQIKKMNSNSTRDEGGMRP